MGRHFEQHNVILMQLLVSMTISKSSIYTREIKCIYYLILIVSRKFLQLRDENLYIVYMLNACDKN